MIADINPNYREGMKLQKFRIYHQKYGLLYPGEFRLKYNRDLMWYLLLLKDPNRPYEKPAEWVMLKYTGRKDMYGKEVYEGDKLAMHMPGVKQEHELTFPVIWNNKKGCFDLQGKSYNGLPENLGIYYAVAGSLYEKTDENSS